MSSSRMQPSRRSDIPAFEVMNIVQRVVDLRAQGVEVISLCVGEPAQGAPTAVRRRAAASMTDGSDLGYSSAYGLHELRAQIAAHYARWYALDVAVDDIAITTGSSGGFLLAFLAAFDAGARVAMARPGYPAYRNLLGALGCEVVELDCGPEVRFQPTVELLADAHARAPLAGLVLASPANPTGTMVPADQLAAIARWCAENGVRLISDEIYHGITFGPDASPGECAWAHDRSAIVVSSFSKFWAMTGWRLGWALVPRDLWARFGSLAGNAALCPPVPAQHAALAAFDESAYAEAEQAVAGFAAARREVLDRLEALGWTDVAPADGAFYVYARPQLGAYADSRAWCEALLEAERVAVTPGTDFDPVHGHATVRISLAAGAASVAEAMERIIRFQDSASAAPGGR
ncbi:pyridoxal phosphate-dependent aminotransferase [Mariniluteicoccus flavus]